MEVFPMRSISYDNFREIDVLIGQTYLYAAIIILLAMSVSFLLANIILFGGGKNDRSHIKRRIIFIVVGLFAPALFFIYNLLFVAGNISKAPLLAKFEEANIIATIAILILYILISISTMFLIRGSKWGSILGNKLINR
jgi:hypothetical protein